MISSIKDSVISITSSDQNQQPTRAFGTGFVIYRTSEATYLLTCAHVVRDVGGTDKVLADGIPAKVVASGESKGFDLAVLRVEGLFNRPKLDLSSSGEERKPFVSAGFYYYDNKETRLLELIQGHLDKQTFILSKDGSDRIKAWKLHTEGEDILQQGYSGSPVVDRDSGAVLAVVSHRAGKGEKGLAIGIEAIERIWSDIPFRLPKENKYQTSKSQSSTQEMEVVLSYSPKDQKLIHELESSLSSLEKITIWHKGKIIAGQNSNAEIEKHIKSAQIIILLISSNFMTDYDRSFEVKSAIERYKQDQKIVVIPILISQVAGWTRRKFGESELGAFEALPKNGIPVNARGWKSKNEAFFTIAEQLEEVIKAIAV